jgi:hypothetical protein
MIMVGRCVISDGDVYIYSMRYKITTHTPPNTNTDTEGDALPSPSTKPPQPQPGQQIARVAT